VVAARVATSVRLAPSAITSRPSAALPRLMRASSVARRLRPNGPPAARGSFGATSGGPAARSRDLLRDGSRTASHPEPRRSDAVPVGHLPDLTSSISKMRVALAGILGGRPVGP
jgi:hypothetical protein